jgi:uncharacterized protein YbbC (DUF1343 family)
MILYLNDRAYLYRNLLNNMLFYRGKMRVIGIKWLLLVFCACFQVMPLRLQAAAPVTGAAQLEVYLPLLKGKRVALLINQTSVVGQISLLDTLLHRGVQVVKIFVPEHGFRGTADAGAKIKNEVDAATGLPVISLYGSNKKPNTEQLANVDILVYDLQDVGVRFYTYISTMQLAMEACAAQRKTFMVLDRPNPNGFYVDGPVLDSTYRSFVGMQPVPVVYGMTAGEYAGMLKGEAWFPGARQLSLKVITCKDYNHKTNYSLPVAPSPNLKTMASVYLYPALCFFEGTVVSVGRGTDKPFQQWGHPAFREHSTYAFTPESTTGASKPLLQGQACYGQLVADQADAALRTVQGQLQLDYLLKAYSWYPEKDKFFNNFFEKLTGTATLRNQVIKGMTAAEIRASWAPGLAAFKAIRARYLLYAD